MVAVFDVVRLRGNLRSNAHSTSVLSNEKRQDDWNKILVIKEKLDETIRRVQHPNGKSVDLGWSADAAFEYLSDQRFLELHKRRSYADSCLTITGTKP